MRRILGGLLGAVAIVLLQGCVGRPPFLILSIEDPTSAAANFAALLVGTSNDNLAEVRVDKDVMPLAITVISSTAGEKTIWVEARAADGRALARGTTLGRFARSGTPTATIQMVRACDQGTECDDGVFCNGRETCTSGICVAANTPCGGNVDCVTAVCHELGGGEGSCTVEVDHALCGVGRYCNPVDGCVWGAGCLDSTDCQDAYQCNGAEQCINLVCAGGVPPVVDDHDICTLDGCDDARVGLGGEAVFHFPVSTLDGSACIRPDDGGPGVCVSAKGGCVISACGDGVVFAAAGEICDDGVDNSAAWSLARHCNTTCLGWAPYCGDRDVTAPDESCDDGDSNDSGNGCSADCQRNDDCGDGLQQALYEQCDDGDADECNGCRTDCTRGCICTNPAVCLSGSWCDEGKCIGCALAARCGPACVACAGEKPLCGGATVGCVCNPSPARRGSCLPSTYCNGVACVPCNTTQHCGGDCLACSGTTSDCGGVDKGCLALACTGKPDFTLCQRPDTPDRSYDICVGEMCVSPGCGTTTCDQPGPSFARADVESGWEYPDTNQRACYEDSTVPVSCPGTVDTPTCTTTPFCGQDWQYGWDTTHPSDARYSRKAEIAGEPVVTDNVTGLMWQGCPGGLTGPSCTIGGAQTNTWDDALAYCDSLAWGGYVDWWLPDVYALSSIIDAGRVLPAVEPTVFPETTANWYWTSTSAASDSGDAWIIYFGDGSLMSYIKGSACRARCVRSGALAAPSVARFARTEPVPGWPVVTDHKTGLMWQGCPDEQIGAACNTGTIFVYNWEQALQQCAGLTWSGYQGWRLPSRAEAMSILDFRRDSPAVDPVAFPATPATWFWTSTSYAEAGTTGAWLVDFTSGETNGYDKASSFTYIRCVRPEP
jgi:hypothetical protein